MKFAISGKGGVGKTTLSSGLARAFVQKGHHVVAIDADPDANLALALGASVKADRECVPLAKWDDLIEERTGVRPGKGGMFKLNPDVSDVVDMCGMDVNGVTVLKMGTVERGGSGCMCAEGTFLQAFISHLVLDRDDVAILDMEAGIEHLGRGTAQGVDVFVVVVEPGSRSIQTALTVRELAADIGVKHVVAVANKVRDMRDAEFVCDHLGTSVELIGVLPDSDVIRAADRIGATAFGADPSFDRALLGIAEKLEQMAEREPSAKRTGRNSA